MEDGTGRYTVCDVRTGYGRLSTTMAASHGSPRLGRHCQHSVTKGRSWHKILAVHHGRKTRPPQPSQRDAAPLGCQVALGRRPHQHLQQRRRANPARYRRRTTRALVPDPAQEAPEAHSVHDQSDVTLTAPNPRQRAMAGSRYAGVPGDTE